MTSSPPLPSPTFREMLPLYVRAALKYAFATSATWRILHLYPKPAVTRSGTLLVVKQVLVISTLALPVTYLALSDSPVEAFFGTYALPGTISVTLLPVLSFMEHTRSVAPSKLLILFHWANFVEDLVQAVRIWDMGLLWRREVFMITAVPLISMLLLAVAEGLPKHSLVKLEATKS